MNTQIKHTPGPWSVRVYYNNEGLTVFSPNNVPVAYVDYDECEERPVEANATLIAAAPAMYEALQNILEFYERSNSNGAEQAAYDKAMKALAQAEGKP